MLEPRVFFPVALNFKTWRCVVVGGGDEAEFKTRIFNDFHKFPDVIAESFTPGLEEIAADGRATLIRQRYSPELLDGAKVVLACSEDESLNLTVGEDAHAKGLLFNMVDNAEVSDFIATSYVRRGNLTVNIMTDGLSPAFANSLRDKIGMMLENGYQEHLEFFVETKRRINGLTDDIQVKKGIWRELVKHGLLELLEADADREATLKVEEVIAKHL